MKRGYLIVGAIVGILIILGISAVLFLRVPASTQNSSSGNPFESSINTGTNSTGTTENSTNALLPITLKDKSSVVVPNFTTKNQPPAASATAGYQVAGANTSSFQILYFPTGSYFLITLNAEPLGQTRAAAEAALRSTLSLSDSELCNLNIQVFTPGFVNESYAGTDLGLSFCPGAVELPQ